MKLPRFTRNFYFIFGFFFLVWMLSIDANDFFTQYQLRNKLKTLEDEKAYYLEKIEEVRLERQELLSNDELLEKFAREKYFMKKESEDIFVIVEKEE